MAKPKRQPGRAGKAKRHPKGRTTPQGTKLPGSPEPTEGRCAARLKKPGTNRAYDPPRHCLSWPRKTRKRCGIHGGKSPRGLASATFKDGQRSLMYRELLGGTLLEGYLAIEHDEQLRSVEEQIRLWTGRERELVARLQDQGESSAAWRRSRELMESIDEIRHRPAPDEASRAEAAADLGRELGELGAVLLEGSEGEAVYRDLERCTDTLRKLKDTDRLRRRDEHAAVSVDQMMHLAGLLTALALRCIELGPKPGAQEFAEGVARIGRGEPVEVGPGVTLGTGPLP